MTTKPVRLTLEAWRGAPMRQPFKIQAGGADITAAGYVLQLLVWDADGAPANPLLTLAATGVAPNTRVALDGSGKLQGDLFITSADLGNLPTGSRPESRQPVRFRAAFLVTPPGGDPAYYGLGDLLVYPKWGVDSVVGSSGTGGQVVLDVLNQTLTYDLGGGLYVQAAQAAQTLAEAAATAATASATAAAGSATTATTKATAADASATAASGSATAAAGSATAAAGSATAAAGSATAAAGSATAAATSATAAQDWSTKTSAEVVVGQGYGALKYAQDASGSATAAAGSATAAGGSATSASGSAAAAAASAASVSSQSVATHADIEERVAIFDPTATAAQRAASVARGVTVTAAASVGSTYFRVGLLASTALTGVATVTRSTSALAADQSGVYTTFSAGSPCVTTAGLQSFEASTNFIRNNSAAGAVAGSPGTAPTNWSLPNPTLGLTRQVVGTGTANGLPYIDVRYSGTATSGGSIFLNLETTLGVAAANGQTWTVSAFLAVVAGGLPGAIKLVGSPRESGGTQVPGSFNSVLTVGATLQRYSITGTFTDATTAAILPYVELAVTNGATVDFTLRIAAPQAEQKAFPTPPIVTSSGSASRNADSVVETVNIPVGQAFTITGKFLCPPAGQSCWVFDLADSTTPLNRIGLSVTSGVVLARHQSAGLPTVNYTFTGLPAIAQGQPVGFAIAVAGSAITFSVNGGAAQAFALNGGPFAAALTKLALGGQASFGLPLNSTLRSLRAVMRAMSAAELATASDVSLTHDLDFTTKGYSYVGDAYAAVTELPGFTFSRSTGAVVDSAAGYSLAVPSGALRVSDAGLTMEPARTNAIRSSNPSQGVVPGTPGTLPTNWATSLASGIARDVVGSGTEFGRPYVDLRFYGTPAASPAATVYFEVSGVNIASAAAVTWAQSAGVRLVGGSLANVLAASLRLGCFDSTPAALTTQISADLKASITANFARLSAVHTTPASTATVQPHFVLSWAAGAIDLTLRFYPPQLEQGASPTGEIVTTTAAASRSGDVLGASGDVAPASYSVAAEFTVPAVGQAFAHVWGWDDGTTNNRIILYYDRANTRLVLQIDTGGVNQTFLILSSAVAPGTSHKVAARVAANDVAASLDGVAVLTDAAVTVPATSNFRIGGGISANTEWGAGLKRLRRWSAGRTNAQLQADAA